MRLIASGAAAIAAVVLGCALSGSSSGGTAATAQAVKRARHAQPKKTPTPCAEIQKQDESQGAETIEWDPLSCWDCSRPDEPLAIFVAGEVILTPIMILTMLARTRRSDAEPLKRVLRI